MSIQDVITIVILSVLGVSFERRIGRLNRIDPGLMLEARSRRKWRLVIEIIEIDQLNEVVKVTMHPSRQANLWQRCKTSLRGW